MKKRAYESDPLPINMRESVYRSGNRDYVLIANTDNKKYKSNGQRLKMQKVLGNLQKLSASTNGDQQTIINVLKQTFWIKAIGDSLEKDRLDYKAKGISTGTISAINIGPNNPKYISQAEGYVKSVGKQKALEQIPNMLSNVGKPINKWPEKWFSAQEAIDFISDDRNKKFQSFSCNNESYLGQG